MVNQKRFFMLALIMASNVLIPALRAAQDLQSEEPSQPSTERKETSSSSAQPREKKSRTRKKRKNQTTCGLIEIVRDAAHDIFYLNRNLFLWDTFKIVSSVFPLFVGARMIDEKLQRCFYDASCHKNINQLPDWCREFAKISIGIPIAFFGIEAIVSKNDDRRWTGQILLLGMPFVIWTKTLVKKMQFDACLRPWNEHFSCEKRSFGGFPSGHMAQALYTAVLYGMRFGPAFAVPLGAMAGLLGVTFVTCNRHYLSQIIAGAGFGTIYALAANKVVEAKMTDRVKLGFKVDDIGRPTLSLAVNF